MRQENVYEKRKNKIGRSVRELTGLGYICKFTLGRILQLAVRFHLYQERSLVLLYMKVCVTSSFLKMLVTNSGDVMR